MRLSMSALMALLRAEGLATAADTDAVRAALVAAAEDEMPVYLRAVVGIGAWVATILLLGFFFEIDLFKSYMEAIVVGVVLVGTTIWLGPRARGEFARHAAVAVSLAGQGLIVFGIDKATHQNGLTATVATFLSIALIVIIPDRLLRFLSTVIAVLAGTIALAAFERRGYLDVAALIVVACACVWRVDLQTRSDEMDEALTPVGFGLIVGLFGICLFGAFNSAALRIRSGDHTISTLGPATTIGIALALAVLVRTVLGEHYTRRRGPIGWPIFAGIALLAAVTLDSPGIIAGIAVLVLGFDRRNVVLIELAIAFLLVFGAAYYYALDLTLLQKSGVLVATGALCFAARLLLGRTPGARAEPVT